jgi:3alpha(or 20beta)-hydroxysteroid dehydrogenase
MTGRLKGKVAFVTGGASGIGLEAARQVVAEGGQVVIADTAADAAAREADALGADATAVTLDVADWNAWGSALDHAIAAFGGVDVLIAAAGIARPGRIEAIDLELHRRIVDVNQHGVFYGMRAVAPLMRARGGGSIINISSIDGMVGVAGLTSYVGAKFAVRGMSRAAALEFAADRIRVNSVHPGVIDTPPVRAGGAAIERMVSIQPVPRMGTAREVASLLVYLASDESGFCTGSEFVIDGGQLAGPIRQ